MGCGYMQGTIELMKYHDKVYAVDTEIQRHRLIARLEMCSRNPHFGGFKTTEEFLSTGLRLGGAYVVNVLHTLPSAQERIALLSAVRRNLRSSGFLLIDVPYYEHYYKGKMNRENAYRDGYLFPQGKGRFTFYRFSTREDIDSWAERAGFVRESEIPDNHHYVQIYRPQ